MRGGRPLAVDLSGNVVKVCVGEKWLIAGDLVNISETGISLVRRIPHYTIAIVTGFMAGVLVDFPFHIGFKTVLKMRERVFIGDRLVVHMTEDGQVKFIAHFSSVAKQDLACASALYNLIDTDADFNGGFDTGKPLYTQSHKDLTHLDTFTVDPALSVDLDDAISIDVSGGRLYVHIVDIHNAVPLCSTLEEVMYRHGSTLYLAEKVQHLLPEEYVHTASLDFGERRSVITVEMCIDSDGSVYKYEIYPSTIIVKHRYNYDEFETLKSLTPYSWLKTFAENNSASLPLGIPGLNLKIGADSMIASIEYTAVDDDAHRMIACAMIAANFTVGSHLNASGVPLPNRFHEAPTGLFAEDVTAITGNYIVDSYLAVKKWRPAYYDLEKKGHFGLGLREYVHFTSPMRRYADVIIHRILAGVQYDNTQLSAMVDAINSRAQTVRKTQKYYTDVKIARYLIESQALKSVYITIVSRTGVCWYSPEFLVNGFTHISKIGTDIRWSFDEVSLMGGGQTICVGSLRDVKHTNYNFSNGQYAVSLL